MNSKKPSDLFLIACMLLLPFAGMSQGMHEDLKTYFSSVILVTKGVEDTTYIGKVNGYKKLSPEEKKEKIDAHKEQVAQYNANLTEAVKYWNGDKKLVVPDEANADYREYTTHYEQATAEGAEDINLYYLSYASMPLMRAIDPIYGETQQPLLVLTEKGLNAGSGNIVTMVQIAQGVPSAGLLGCYFNVLNAQMIDTEKEITWKNEEVFAARMKELKDKTLLIPKQLVSDKLTKESIAQTYPYAFEILDENELDAKLQSDERNKCVIYQVIPQTAATRAGVSDMGFVSVGLAKSAILYRSALFDAGSGRRMDIQEVKLSLAGSAGTNELTKGELKKMVSQIE